MSVEQLNRRHGPGDEHVATLIRSVPVRLVEVSWGGCRLESESRLPVGTSGLLAVELAGTVRVDDVRVARCQQLMGAGATYHLGAELLRTRRFGHRTVRMAVKTLMSDDRGGGRGPGAGPCVDEEPPAAETRSDATGGETETRPPPLQSKRGPRRIRDPAGVRGVRPDGG